MAWKPVSDLETTLLFQIRAVNLPDPLKEYRFAPPRRWRFDMCWPDNMLAVEIEGGAWTQGRHTRGKGFIADMEKYNKATLMGWRLLRFSGEHIQNGTALAAIEAALCSR